MKLLDLWYGTEDSLLELLRMEERVEALEAQGEAAIRAKFAEVRAARGLKAMDDDDVGMAFGLPPIWEERDGVAVMDISGPLMSGHAGLFRLFGGLGYADIQQAAAEIAVAKGVKSVLLLVDSGGGAVNGVADAGETLRNLAAVKPVWSFTDGGMLSAAYWLGASADQVFASKTAQVGSVGTLMVHTEVTKKLEAEGVKKTVIRNGKYKALGNPYEVLSDDARAEMQAMADEAGSIFVEYVADRRGVPPATFQKTMGEGRVFMGRPAKEVGLIDGVSSLSGVLSAMKKLDKVKVSHQNSRNQGNATMKATLASALVLSLIGGAAVEGLDLKVAAATAEGVEPDADAQAALTAQAQEVKAAADALAAQAVTAAVTPLQAQVSELQAEVTSVKEEVGLAKAAAQTLTAERDVARELSDSMALILRDSISVMSVALQGAKDAGKDLTGQALLDEHARLAAQFKSKYPAGGVAAVGVAEETAASKKAEVDPLFMHAVHSLRPQGSRK